MDTITKATTVLSTGQVIQTEARDGATYVAGTNQVVSRSNIISTTVGDKTYAGDASPTPTSNKTVTVSKGDQTITVSVNAGGGLAPNSGNGLNNYIVGGGVEVDSGGRIISNGVDTGYKVVTPTPPSSSSGGHSHSSYIPPAPPAPTAPTSPTAQKQIPVNKYEYIYGLKEIQINGIANEKRSIYVSKPVLINGNIAEIELESNEIHPILDARFLGADSLRYTSIEYYVSYVDNDWIPILPKYEEMVINELLFIKNNEALFRFPAMITKDIHVYENGVLYSNWHISPSGDGVLFTGTINSNSDYTVDYYPDEARANPYVVKVLASKVKPIKYINEYNEEGEVFNLGTKPNCSINLKHTPYINYELINSEAGYNPNSSSYKPMEVYIENGNIAIPLNKTTDHVDPYNILVPEDICTKNMTDYVKREIVELKPYSLKKKDDGKPENMVFEYYQDKNKLVFTETFRPSTNIDNLDIAKATGSIRVKYEYLTSSIRVKIILRRTGRSEDTTLTPSVEEYTLRVKTLE